MSEPISQNTAPVEPSFRLNYISVILALVILIPVIYTVITNLQPPPAAPVINHETTQTQNTATPANGIETALKAVADKPNYNTYINLGMAYYGKAQYEECIAAWKKALEYNPKSELAYNNLAAAYGAVSKWDEEIDACEKALAINPNFDLAKRNMEWAKNKKAGK